MLRKLLDAIMENYDHSKSGCYARALRRGDKLCIYGSGGMCRVLENYTQSDWDRLSGDTLQLDE